ncbi:MAG: DUF4012 domain-containing protein [Candidatus Magasanikbacteria bacterium]
MFNNPFERKPPKWPWILLAFAILFLGSAWFLYHWLSSITPEQIVESPFVREQVERQFGESGTELLEALPELLGFSEPKTYLLLFLNNTELRPGGGFIGSYAVVTLDKGNMQIDKMEGTERIDRDTPDSWRPVPPAILREQLKVDRWYFRDSNWFPDFAESAKKGLELFTGEGGVKSGDIDAVVGIDTTVLEEIMKKVGPITIDGITFTADDVTEKLEYEVEYGYDEKGIHFLERKKIMGPLMLELLARLKNDAWKRIDEYGAMVNTLASEKHIVVYSSSESLKKMVDKKGWNGTMADTEGDYLLWADANLAALKTDHAIERSLHYSLSRRPPAHESEVERYLASASMTYVHKGTFDWRTTRYRTYTRIFVPDGSELVTVMVNNGKNVKTFEPSSVDQGTELGKKWFGVFVSIEPGNTGNIQFMYQLPDGIKELVEKGLYTLRIQKQIGTLAPPLTLDLDFGKTITSANPGEAQEKWGDSIYELNTDLRVDRSFDVHF